MPNITTAIKNLPPHLLTEDIIKAGIEDGNPEIINFIPVEYLTEKAILKLISKTTNQFYLDSFDLSRIPKKIKTKAICEYAVKANIHNFQYVPNIHRTSDMLRIILATGKKGMLYLSEMPESVWTKGLAFMGLKQIISDATKTYTSRRSSHTSIGLDLIQAFLTFVPQRIKDFRFYLGLFKRTELSAKDIQILIPDKFKQGAYYVALAGKDFKLVPESKYGYEHFKMILADCKSYAFSQMKDNSRLMSLLTDCMDDTLADMAVIADASYFSKLPKKFQTSRRLFTAIENCSNSWMGWVTKVDVKLLNKKICRTLIKKKCDLPKIPADLWDSDFVEFCVDHGQLSSWIKLMPYGFWTQELADRIFDMDVYNIKYIPEHLITYDHALKANRGSDKKYIPKQYYQEFRHETGLPDDFMGGEVSLSRLRDHSGKYIYTRLGQSYIGFYEDGYRNKIILTRRSSDSIYPVKVFEATVKTFHTTWLEKLIADNDPQYEKPENPKKLKDLLINPYYSLKEDVTYKNIKIYRNTLLDETISYAANIKDEGIFSSTLDEIRESIDEYLKP